MIIDYHIKKNVNPKLRINIHKRFFKSDHHRLGDRNCWKTSKKKQKTV